MSPSPTLSAIDFSRLAAGEFDLLHLPEGLILSESERIHLLSTLEQMPYTFTYPDMPSCWGKAFENYLSMGKYLAPHPDDDAIARLCAPIQSKVENLLAASGFQVRPLIDPVSGRAYTQADFRRGVAQARATILHVDDLTMDATLKPDFVLPEELQGRPFFQCMVLLLLDTRGATATLRCHHRRYQSEHEPHRLENGWQFSHDVVKDFGYSDWQPEAGGAVIMPNQYYHDILGGGAEGEWFYYSQYLLFVPGSKVVYSYI